MGTDQLVQPSVLSCAHIQATVPARWIASPRAPTMTLMYFPPIRTIIFLAAAIAAPNRSSTRRFASNDSLSPAPTERIDAVALDTSFAQAPWVWRNIGPARI